MPGRTPVSVAAAAIYMVTLASKDKSIATKIADIAGVAETTILATYKDMTRV